MCFVINLLLYSSTFSMTGKQHGSSHICGPVFHVLFVQFVIFIFKFKLKKASNRIFFQAFIFFKTTLTFFFILIIFSSLHLLAAKFYLQKHFEYSICCSIPLAHLFPRPSPPILFICIALAFHWGKKEKIGICNL